MRVWIDLTNSPHVLVMRPVIDALHRRGDEVLVTARDFAQTLGLLERFQIDHTAIGHHRGGHVAAKALGLASRSGALVRWASGKRIDLALGHGSNDISIAAKLLRIPSATAFDYEWARQQHQINCRLATRVVVPDVIPPERLAPYGATLDKLRRYEGLKEEYYLADFEPDTAVLAELGLDRERPLAVVRTPPAVSLYHRFEAPVFTEVLHRLKGEQVVVLPRTDEQRAELAREGGFIVPEQAIDAQSLIAFADLVISAGGTMNREAVALGTPVWTTFEGRLGAVDERLIADGRMRRLTSAEDVVFERRTPGADAPARIRRDPAVFTDLLREGALGPRVFTPQRPIHCPRCAAGSAQRPFRSTATRFRSWCWTRGWSHSLTTWLTAAVRRRHPGPLLRPLHGARSRSRSSARWSASPRSACTGTGCGTRRSASTSRSPRASSSRVLALVGYVAVVQPQLISTGAGFVSITIPTGVLDALRPAHRRVAGRHALPRALHLRAAAERLPRVRATPARC